jgi:hypothetical protein
VGEPVFVFLQMEFPWLLGPPDGRYLMRAEAGGQAEHVVVFDTLATGRADQARHAPRRGLLARAARRLDRPQGASPTPAAVSTSRVTVVDPVSLSAERQARAWLDDLDVERHVRDTLHVVNRVIQLHRIASADPHVREVSPSQALVIRAGWGKGEQVADGRWLHARELLPPPERGGGGLRRAGSKARTAALRPQERLAAMLGARNDSLLCEELVLRARLDLDHDRLSLAALELAAALRVGAGELADEGRQDLALRLAELEQLREGVERQAQAAQGRDGAALEEDVVRHALERLEAALRARTAPGF